MYLNELYRPLLWLHIGMGAICLLSGLVIMLARKGTVLHRRLGRIYFYDMLGVCTSALLLTYIHPNPFLAVIAVFSFYAAYKGFVLARRKNFTSRPVDWLMLALLAGASIYMISTLNPILLVFGGIAAFLGFMDLRALLGGGNLDPSRWVLRHIGNMIGSYIATTTAFLLNAVHFPEPLIGWLGPTVLGVPIIIYWIRARARELKRS